MVRKVVGADSGHDLAIASHGSGGDDGVPETKEVTAEDHSVPLLPARTGRELWSFLRPRLGVLVRLQQQWGSISSLYDGKRESRADDFIVPRYIRDPDTAFCAYWDLVQVFGE